MLITHLQCRVWQNFKVVAAQICQGREDGLAGVAYSLCSMIHMQRKFNDDITKKSLESQLLHVLSLNLKGKVSRIREWGIGNGRQGEGEWRRHSSQLCKEGKWEYIERQRVMVVWPHPLLQKLHPINLVLRHHKCYTLHKHHLLHLQMHTTYFLMSWFLFQETP